MAKDLEKKNAYEFYVVQRKTAKESARLARVTEKTMGTWIKTHNWKERRNALMSSSKSGLENICELIEIYSENLLDMERDSNADPKEKLNLVNSIAALRKTKNEFEKNHKVPLDVYIVVADRIMSELVTKHPKQKDQFLDFFEEHLTEVSQKY